MGAKDTRYEKNNVTWFQISDFGFRIFWFRVSGFGFRVSGFRVSGFGVRFSGFGFRGSGFDFQVSHEQVDENGREGHQVREE
jgi:hypothetical protein